MALTPEMVAEWARGDGWTSDPPSDIPELDTDPEMPGLVDTDTDSEAERGCARVHVNHLPADALQQALEYLPVRDMRECSRVARPWHLLATYALVARVLSFP